MTEQRPPWEWIIAVMIVLSLLMLVMGMDYGARRERERMEAKPVPGSSLRASPKAYEPGLF